MLRPYRMNKKSLFDVIELDTAKGIIMTAQHHIPARGLTGFHTAGIGTVGSNDFTALQLEISQKAFIAFDKFPGD